MNAALNRFGAWLTSIVGTMWCALAFAALATVSLPDALRSGRMAIVQWIAQTFLQLVLLSVIMVGQEVQARKVEARDVETHDVVMLSHQEILAEHIEARQRLEALQRALDALRGSATVGTDPYYPPKRQEP